MTYDEFKNLIIKYANEMNISEYDLFYSSETTTSIFAFDGDIDSYSDQTEIGVCFRCIVDGKMGYSSTQKLNGEEAYRIVSDAKVASEIIESDDFVEIFAGSEKYAEIPKVEIVPCDIKKLKQSAIDIEKYCKEADKRVVSVPYAVSEYSSVQYALMNSHGLDLKSDETYYSAVCQAVLEENGRKYLGTKAKISNKQSEIDSKFISEQAVAKAVRTIGGMAVKSGQYPVVFQNDMADIMFSTFAGIFSADAAQNGLSLLAGKEGTQIASPLVTITDDPRYPDSPVKSNFDGEGVATYAKNMIENGVLKTLLYDLKSARKAGKESTGNGRRSYASKVSIGMYSMVMKPGEISFDELVKKVGNGILVTELKGMHASANPTSGDFSLEAKGFIIENGVVTRPTEPFTVAGNFFDMMKDISDVANDTEMFDSMDVFPSILVRNLSIAGES